MLSRTSRWSKLLGAIALVLVICYLALLGIKKNKTLSSEAVTESNTAIPIESVAPVPSNSPSQIALNEIEGLKDPVISGFANRIALETAAELGMGYSPLSGEMRGRALGPFKVNAREKNTENAVSYDFKYIGSNLELARSLNISAHAAFTGITGGGSASLNLFRSATVNTTNVYMLVRMSVISEVRTIENYDLNPVALKKLQSYGLNSFSTAYGDAFIYSITYGGELYALLEFETSSKTEAQRIRADVSGKLGGFSASASLEEKMKSILETKNIRVYYSQSGGASGEPVKAGQVKDGKLEFNSTGGVLIVDQNELVERIRRFPGEVRKYSANSKPIYGETLDYNVAQNIPKDKKFTPNFRPQWLLEDLARLKLTLDSEYATAERVISSGTRYTDEDQKLARIRLNYLEQVLIELNRVGIALLSTPSIVQSLAEKASLLPINSTEKNVKPCPIFKMATILIKECLLGKSEFEPNNPAPMTVKQFRVWYGENNPKYAAPDPGIRGGPWWGDALGCISRPELEAHANNVCGKATNSDILVEIIGTGSVGGEACGYESFTIVCITP